MSNWPAPFSSGSDIVLIEGLRLSCVIGVYPHERTRPQGVELQLAVAFDARAAALSGELSRTIDYEKLSRLLTWVLQHARFHLLETAGEALSRLVLAPPAPDLPGAHASAVSLRLAKLEALESGAVPSLRLGRSAAETSAVREVRRFGSAEVLFDGANLRLERLILSPGSSAPGIVPAGRQLSLCAASGGLLLDGQPLTEAHGLCGSFEVHNPTAVERSLLLVDVPRE